MGASMRAWESKQWLRRKTKTQLCESILYLMGESVDDYNNDANMPNWTLTVGEKPFTLTPSRILGDIFIEVYHTVSDSGNLQLRFAEAAEQASRVQNHVLEILFSTLFG
ncbi:cyprosin-like [Eucalyptus grandis]|uniref:cyprosin-like n=1 Tax=Eucalyptus grandis TaxID=71139 RepID=UPI00192ED74D|nr:cyprosin-like [Eucalyptus grandis]